MFVLILILLICMVLHIFSLRGRKHPNGLDALKPWAYAHRGLHDPSKPENSMAAFRAALEKGYGIELDVHLLKDGTLAILHDSDLKRVTGREGILEELTAEDLPTIHLAGPQETIPTLGQVLDLYAGQAPLIIELKTYKENADVLTEAVCRMLENYRGPFCLESFDPRCLFYLRRHHPELIRGQLSENSIKRDKTFPWPVRLICTYYLENFLTRPDFIAYRFEDRKTVSNTICRSLWGIQGVSWTIKTPEDFQTAMAEDWIPIFEGFDPKELGIFQ